jgi:hypothetical protein
VSEGKKKPAKADLSKVVAKAATPKKRARA